MSEQNLSRVFEEFNNKCIEEGNEEATVEDFFDYAGVEEENRTDFGFAAILKDVNWDNIRQEDD